jgi:small subunit ribosomal protein S16
LLGIISNFYLPLANGAALPRTARNSKPLEVIGTYDPIPKADPYDDSGRLHKDIKLDVLRAKYWLGVGAQPTDTTWRLLSMVSQMRQ